MGRNNLVKSRPMPVHRRSGLRVAGKKLSPERLCKILDYMCQMPVQTDAAEFAGIATWTIRDWVSKSERGQLAVDPITWNGVTGPFHEHYEAAVEEGVDRIESNLFKRALGYKEAIPYQGRVLYKYDHRLLALGFIGPEAWLIDPETGLPVPESIDKQDPEAMMFILKARRPKIYGSHQQIDVTQKIGVLVVGARKSPEELEKMYGGERTLPKVQFIDQDAIDVAAESSEGGSDE